MLRDENDAGNCRSFPLQHQGDSIFLWKSFERVLILFHFCHLPYGMAACCIWNGEIKPFFLSVWPGQICPISSHDKADKCPLEHRPKDTSFNWLQLYYKDCSYSSHALHNQTFIPSMSGRAFTTIWQEKQSSKNRMPKTRLFSQAELSKRWVGGNFPLSFILALRIGPSLTCPPLKTWYRFKDHLIC